MIILPIHCTALNAANNQVHCHFSIWNWANTSNLAKTKNKIYLVNCKWVDSIVTRMHISDWIVNLFAFFRLRKKNAFNLPFGVIFFSLATCYILHVKRSAISIRSYIYILCGRESNWNFCRSMAHHNSTQQIFIDEIKFYIRNTCALMEIAAI